mgnify:CR=1 FL=1|tara:strand:- start:1058 stop:2176 length:1119 start_codon:yes stop_codon:yes gene_type:complete
MATTYKKITTNDTVSTRTLLHEAVPVTGTIVSGTYNGASTVTEQNIKNYSHGMFQSVYDYPYLSSSANHIFDLTVGYSNNSTYSGSAVSGNAKKINLYTQMAQVLVGFDQTGSVRDFDRDGDFAGGTKNKECFFINFARLLNKDEMKKGSFILTMVTGGTAENVGLDEGGDTDTLLTISDYGAANNYKVNSPAGEYGILYTASYADDSPGTGVGLIYYQAGIAVISGSIFSASVQAAAMVEATSSLGIQQGYANLDSGSFSRIMTGSHISSSCDAIRGRISNITFDNTTELNSTIYFCRANHNDFNYSSNPSYLTGSKIRIKGNKKSNEPKAYVTAVGLYSADNELLAVAKLSEPLKKTPSNELTLRCRLDY